MTTLFKSGLLRLTSSLFQHYKSQFVTSTRNFASYRRKKKPQIVPSATVEEQPIRRKHRPFPLYENQPLQLASKLDKRPKQKFDYFLVLDFEATCDAPINLEPQVVPCLCLLD